MNKRLPDSAPIRPADMHARNLYVACPFALEKMRYEAKSGMVIYRSKLHATLKRKTADAGSNVAAAADEPHPRQVRALRYRYYGDYSNRSRGARRIAKLNDDPAAATVIDDSPVDTRRKANRARLIQKVVALGHPWR